jgi:hypothetical protein
MTLADDLKQRIREEIERYKKDPDAAAHAIAWSICRYAYALGYAKGLEGGQEFPNDAVDDPVQDGHWFAGYAFADPSPLNRPVTSQA